MENNRDLLSYEIQCLISHKPHFIVRWGLAILLIVLTFLSTLTLFIRYPDTIKGSVRLRAVNAPKLLTARTEGKLEKLLIADEQDVQQGQAIAFLQSTAKHDQVLILRECINDMIAALPQADLNVLNKIAIPTLNDLGEIQPEYEKFMQAVHTTRQTLNSGYFRQKEQGLQEDLNYLAIQQENVSKQKALLQQDLELQKADYKVRELLAYDKVIAPMELNQDKSKTLSKELALQQVSSQVINNVIARHDKKKELLELEKLVSDQRQSFHYSLFNLKSAIEDWIQRYIVTAPISGKAIFVTFLQENQLLAPNQELFYVQPVGSEYYAELSVAQAGFGKIKDDQHVIIRMESFPSEEYGYLRGIIKHISRIPTSRDSFLIKVDLPAGLKTNYNREIMFRNNLLARGEILTDSRRLFDRLIGEVVTVTER